MKSSAPPDTSPVGRRRKGRFRRGGAIALVAMLPCLPGSAAPASDFSAWKVAAREPGITLETRKNKATGVLETRVTVRLRCSPEALWQKITRPKPYLELMPKAKESRHLREAPGEVIVYQRLDGSPGSDRDYTLEIAWTVEELASGKHYHRAWHVANHLGPKPVPGVLRVTTNHGSWDLFPQPAGTRFVYQNYIELGGSIWNLFANKAAKDTALGFARNLRKSCARSD